MAKTTQGKKPKAPKLYCQKEETRAVHELLGKIGDKWSILLMVVLSRSGGSRARFSVLLNQVEGISQRMLTTTLRDLERDGFVAREVFPEIPPRVEYELTGLGKSLLAPLGHLVDWTLKNWPQVREARERFESKRKL